MRTPDMKARRDFLVAVKSEYADELVVQKNIITRKQIISLVESFGLPQPNWLFSDPAFRASRGAYNISELLADFASQDQEASEPVAVPASVELTQGITVAKRPVAQPQSIQSLIPEKYPDFISFGNYSKVRQIIASKEFLPIYITGHSGTGKTLAVQQACAWTRREMIRVNITIETDEDDLLGGFRLDGGNTVWHDGPVVQAMRRGAVLLLDEVDLGSNRLLCLQPILEGSAIYLKKIGELVTPAKGFQIVATANTKGKGSDDAGRYIGTNPLNEAFLERFPFCYEQTFPTAQAEKKILNGVLESLGVSDENFSDKLVTWAEAVRKTFDDGAVSELISTRRLVHICRAYSIFGRDREEALTVCLNRFDDSTKTSFLELYKKIDETLSPVPEVQEEVTASVPTLGEETIKF